MRRVLLPLIVLILFIAPAIAQETRTLSADVLWEMQRIGSPVISPDGRWVVAPVTRYDVEEDESQITSGGAMPDVIRLK